MIAVGDLNIAPLETDVWSHKQLLGVVSHTPPETEGLDAWMNAGVVDAVRHEDNRVRFREFELSYRPPVRPK